MFGGCYIKKIFVWGSKKDFPSFNRLSKRWIKSADPNWDIKLKGLILQYSGIMITGLGFFIAIYQLNIASKQYFEDQKKKSENYLDLSIKVNSIKNHHKIKTRVFNKSGEDKDIFFSFILISKQDKDIIKEVTA